MTDIQDEGGDASRFRDPGIAEALLRLGPEAAATHPGVLTQCGGTWVHRVCDGRTVEVREVSGAELAAEVPVRKAQSLLKGLSGLSAGRSRLWEKAVELCGEAVRFEREAVAPTGGERPERIHASSDGTGVPMRGDALEGRAGKGDDGRAGTREAKLLRLCEMAPDPKTGKAKTVPGSVTQSAAIDSAAAPEHGTSAFEARLRREARRRGAHDAREIVIVSDGAPWIENTADRVFGTGNVNCILDQFHVLETLRAAVRAMEPDPAEEERRCERLKSLIKTGEVEPVIRELSRHATRHEEVAKCVGHFRSNLHRMRYGDCRAKGMPVGSGVIEGGCKSVTCGRMKKGGARRSMEGANNIMALRCCSLNNRMTDLFDWRRAA